MVISSSGRKPRLVSPREFRFVLICGAIILGISSLPYLVGMAVATEDRVFGGFIYAVEDCYSYLSKMRQGAEGGWLFHIAYTPEPHAGTLFFPFHLLLGKLAVLLPGDDLTARMVRVYHTARIVLGMGLLLTLYRFLAAFTKRIAVRRLAWSIVALSGGLGWLVVVLGTSNWLGSTPLDFILPEGFTFLVLYAFPHIALARTLLLWGILFQLRAWDAGRGGQNSGYWSATASGVLWLVMGLVVPFYVAVVWAVVGAAWLALGLRRRRVLWKEGRTACWAFFVSSPIVLYSAWVFTTDPVYSTWASQNRILSPHPLHYVAAYGVPLALAICVVRDVWRRKGPGWLALAWVGIVPLLVYLPFNLQRRLVEGVQVPLSLLAAQGLLKIADLTSRRSRQLLIGVVMVLLSLTNVLLVSGNSLALRGRPAAVYRDAGEVAALDWLSQRVGSDDVVLAAYETGNYLPARVGARAFVGHGPESVRPEEKKALVARFFGETPDAWRRDLLREYGVDYIFWGPVERSLGGFEPRAVSFLRAVFDVNGYTVFEFVQ